MTDWFKRHKRTLLIILAVLVPVIGVAWLFRAWQVERGRRIAGETVAKVDREVVDAARADADRVRDSAEQAATERAESDQRFEEASRVVEEQRRDTERVIADGGAEENKAFDQASDRAAELADELRDWRP